MKGRTGIPRLLIVSNVDWFFISHRLHLVPCARQEGFDVHVAVASTGRLDEIQQAGAVVHDLPLSRAGLSPLVEAKAIWRLRSFIRAVQPDLLHLVGLKAITHGLIASLAVRRRLVPIAALSGFGHTLDGDGNRMLRGVVVFVLRILIRASRATVLVQSSAAAQALLSWRLCSPNKISIIEGSGVDTKVFSPTRRNAKSGDITYVMTGRLIGEKGLNEYLEACRLCRHETGSGRFVLAGIPDVGGNPTAWPIELTKARCREAGVELLLNVSDMPALLKQSHVYVHASYSEGLSKSLLEAASCGLAIVATDIPGNQSVVSHESTGLLVPVRDSRALATAMSRLMHDSALRQELGAAARGRCEERFSLEHVQSDTVRLWKTLVGGEV